jgi:hypothetical protein
MKPAKKFEAKISLKNQQPNFLTACATGYVVWKEKLPSNHNILNHQNIIEWE